MAQILSRRLCLTQPDAMLEAGPATQGWDEDQCRTLARIAELARERFRVQYTPAGMNLLLHRIGWSVQVPGGGPPSGMRRRSRSGGR